MSVCEEGSANGEDGDVRVEERLKMFVNGMTFVYAAQRSVCKYSSIGTPLCLQALCSCPGTTAIRGKTYRSSD